MAPPDEAEKRYRRLWRCFYDTIAIRERENPKLRMSHMPKRFWPLLTEFQADPDAIPPSPSPCAAFAAPTLQPRYLHLRHAKHPRRLLLRQRLEKAQQDRHALPLRQQVDRRAKGKLLDQALLRAFRAEKRFQRQPVAHLLLKGLRRGRGKVGIRDLLDAQAGLLRKLREDRFAPELHPQLLPRTIDALRPLAQGPAHLYRAVVTEKSPYFTRDLWHGVGGKLRSVCKVKSLNSL